MRRFGLVLCLALVMAAPAGAHEPLGAKSGYVSTVSTIKPFILGLQASVLGGQDKLLVRNFTKKSVVVDGHVIAPGRSVAWHDHRIGWFHPDPPTVVSRDPGKAHYLGEWRVPGTVGGKPFVIRGLLGYAPPPQSKDDRSWVLPAAIGAAVAAVAVGVGARRVRRRAP